MTTNDDGGGMPEEERELFVRAFFMIDHEDRVRILRDHGLVDGGYVPSRKDDRGAWYKTALTRAAKRGLVESVRDDVFDLVRRQKHGSGEAPEDLGLDPEGVEAVG